MSVGRCRAPAARSVPPLARRTPPRCRRTRWCSRTRTWWCRQARWPRDRADPRVRSRQPARLFTGGPGVSRVYLVHRIDLPTSGLLVFAKTELANKELGRRFSVHDIEREYRLVVVGVPVGAADDRSAHPRQARRHPRVGRGGFAGAALLSARLETGRSHQIRIHLAGEGHPLLGDTEHGGERSRLSSRGRRGWRCTRRCSASCTRAAARRCGSRRRSGGSGGVDREAAGSAGWISPAPQPVHPGPERDLEQLAAALALPLRASLRGMEYRRCTRCPSARVAACCGGADPLSTSPRLISVHHRALAPGFALCLHAVTAPPGHCEGGRCAPGDDMSRRPRACRDAIALDHLEPRSCPDRDMSRDLFHHRCTGGSSALVS